MPYSSQRRVTRSRTSALISISGGHSRAPSGSLVRRVDPELAAVELEGRRVVEVVERPLGEQHVALRIDVGADAEEHLLVVVHVDPFVHDDDRLRQRSSPRPQIACITFCAWPGNCLRIETMQQLWNAPATGGRSRRAPARSSGSPAGRSAPSPCRARRPPAAACRRRSTGRSRRGASSARSRGRRERLDARVVAGVVAERPLGREVARLDVALEHDLRVRGNLDGDRLRRNELDRRALRKPASMNSSMCFGSGADAEYALTGSSPSATATSSRPSANR